MRQSQTEHEARRRGRAALKSVGAAAASAWRRAGDAHERSPSEAPQRRLPPPPPRDSQRPEAAPQHTGDLHIGTHATTTRGTREGARESRRAGPGGRLERREGAAARGGQAHAPCYRDPGLGGQTPAPGAQGSRGVRSSTRLDYRLRTPRESVPAPISRWSRATSVERNGRAESGAESCPEAGLSVLHPGHLPVDRSHRHWPRRSHGTSRRPQRLGA